MRLIEPYLGKGHKFFVYNYYTSPILFHDLYQQQTGACGTLRVNHMGVPADLKTSKLIKGEGVAMTIGTLQILKEMYTCVQPSICDYLRLEKGFI